MGNLVSTSTKYTFDIPPVSLESSKDKKENEVRAIRQSLKQEDQKVNILVWGTTGVGKSTFVNSAVNAMQGEKTKSRLKVAKSAATGMDGTVHIRKYGADCRTGETLGDNICIWDVMGDRQEEMKTDDGEGLGEDWQQVLDLVCKGKLPDRSKMTDRSDVLQHARKEPGNIDERAHALIVIISAQRQDDVQLALSVLQWANQQVEDIHVLIGLTHLDKFDKAYWGDYSNYQVKELYKEEETLNFLKKLIQKYEFDKGDIFPLVGGNIFSAYTGGDDAEKLLDADLLTLQLLDRAYQMGKEYRKELADEQDQDQVQQQTSRSNRRQT